LHPNNRKPKGTGNQVEDEREHDPTLGKGVTDLQWGDNAVAVKSISAITTMRATAASGRDPGLWVVTASSKSNYL
jgi:hypothetical protein